MKIKMKDISGETFGKYQFGTQYLGYWWADSDFSFGGGCGVLKPFVKSDPFQGGKRVRYIPILSEFLKLIRVI